LTLPVGLVQRPDDLPPSAALAALLTAVRSELRAVNHHQETIVPQMLTSG
jgi:hypothetical protein